MNRDSHKSANPSASSPKLLPVVLLGLAVIGLYLFSFLGILSRNAMRYLFQIFLYIVLGEAWNLLSGFTGMTSLGQQLYVGLAGYAVAVVTNLWRMPFPLGIALGVLISVVVSFLLSGILFRMKGMFFAIATWVAAEACQNLFLSMKAVNQGGGLTVTIVPYPGIQQLYLMALTLCVLSLATLFFLLKSKLGLGLLAMRDSPEAAAAIGINLYRNRLTVYLIATVLTSLAGALFFINKGMIYPNSGFSVTWTVSAVFICIIGGTGTLEGPVVGAVVYVLLQEFLAHYPGWSNLILGLITILVICFLPEGIVGALQKQRNAVRARHTVIS